MTIAELKALLADWPDTHEDGESCKVWLGDGKGLSNEVRETSPLNVRIDGDKRTADLILSHDV